MLTSNDKKMTYAGKTPSPSQSRPVQYYMHGSYPFTLLWVKKLYSLCMSFAHISCMSCVSGMTAGSSGGLVFPFFIAIYNQLRLNCFFMTSSVWWCISRNLFQLSFVCISKPKWHVDFALSCSPCAVLSSLMAFSTFTSLNEDVCRGTVFKQSWGSHSIEAMFTGTPPIVVIWELMSRCKHPDKDSVCFSLFESYQWTAFNRSLGNHS